MKCEGIVIEKSVGNECINDGRNCGIVMSSVMKDISGGGFDVVM